jgi:superfamily II DNA or RNA helicase
MNCDTYPLEIGEWRLQPHQSLIKYFTNPKVDNFRSLFLFHNVGSGKTCSSVLASEQYSEYLTLNNIDGFIYIIGNSISHNEFINTIIGECGKIAVNIPFDNIGRYDETDEISSNLKKKHYKFLTFQKFGHDSILKKIKNFNNSLVIVDEAHSLLNENKFYKNFITISKRSKNHKILLLSATPVINNPENLVNFINILQTKDYEEATREDFFKKGKLRNDWMKGIIKYFKNRVSYVQTYNETDFPKIIEKGEKLKGFKNIKVIRCFMENKQKDVYENKYKGKIFTEIRNIMDFIFFDSNDEPIYFNIINKIKSKGTNWLKKNNIKITKNNVISGKFMKLSNLKKYSIKYWRCLKEIINSSSGNGLIFSRYVYNSGILLFGEILKWNGFIHYGENFDLINKRDYMKNKLYKNPDKDFIPARFYVLHGGIDRDERNKIIKIFNSKENRDGKIIKYILGSNLIKESVNLKRVQHVHILGYQDNLSRLNQIIGRAVRYKSHIDTENFVNVYKYVVSIKNSGTFTAEEMEYFINEKKYLIIKKIERGIKMVAIDCNKNKNIFNKKHDYKEICDYMKCEYSCIFKDFEFNNDKLMYDIFYSHYDLFDIYNCIIRIFRNEFRLSIEKLLEILKKYKKEYILTVLDKMIDFKIKFRNSLDRKGYLITDNRDVYFHPDDYDYIDDKISLSINSRKQMKVVKHIYTIDNIINRIIEEDEIKMKKIDINSNLLKRLPILSKKEKINILEKVLLLNKNLKIRNDFLLYFKDFLIDKDVVKNGVLYNKNFDNKVTGRNFIGHNLENFPKIYNKKLGKFEFRGELLYRKDLIENDFIIGYGYRDKDKMGVKLKYASHFLDKRKKSKGFVCKQTNNKKEIEKIYEKLSGKKINGSSITDICLKINNLLRSIQYKTITDGKLVRWFYDLS